jgi:hypothetical protein
MNPLWIISLFLGLAQATVGIAATQAGGWVQGLLATFAVAFPSAVAAAFFVILWKKPFILYAPRDFPGQTSIKDFRVATEYPATVSSASDRSLANVEAAIQTAFETVLIPRLDAWQGEGNRRSLVDEAVAAARRDYRDRAIEVDLSGIYRGLAHYPLIVPVTDDTTVTDLLDNIYFAISAFVDNFSYNRTWILEDDETGRRYDKIGMLWARDRGDSGRDRRRLAEAGIRPGAHLRAVWKDTTLP